MMSVARAIVLLATVLALAYCVLPAVAQTYPFSDQSLLVQNDHYGILQDAFPGVVDNSAWPSQAQKNSSISPRPLLYRDASGNLVIGDDVPDSFVMTPPFYKAMGTPLHEEFNGPAHATDRPSAHTFWEPIGTGSSFEIAKTARHGNLLLHTGTAQGSGGLVSFPLISGGGLNSGDTVFCRGRAARKERVLLEIGFVGSSDSNMVALTVTTNDTGLAEWTATSSNGSCTFTQSTGAAFNSTAFLVGVEVKGGDRYGSSEHRGIDFWVATADGALVRRARLETCLPTALSMKPFVRVRLGPGSTSGPTDTYFDWLFTYRTP